MSYFTLHFTRTVMLVLKFATLRAANILSLEAIRAEKDENIERDEYLDYSSETLERRRNFTAVLVNVFACLE